MAEYQPPATYATKGGSDLSSLSAGQLAEKVALGLVVPDPDEAFRDAEAALAELVSRLKTADGTVDELATELAEERTQHQAVLGRLKTAEDALALIAGEPEAERRAYYNENNLREGDPMRGIPTMFANLREIAKHALAALRPNPNPFDPPETTRFDSERNAG